MTTLPRKKAVGVGILVALGVRHWSSSRTKDEFTINDQVERG
jgi:hypothetical protein